METMEEQGEEKRQKKKGEDEFFWGGYLKNAGRFTLFHVWRLEKFEW